MAEDTTTRAIETGVALMVAVLLAGAGMQMASSYDYTETFSIDSETEWNDNGATLTSVVVDADGYVELDDTETTGTYESDTVNESASRWVVDTDIAEPDNSSVELTVDGTTYDLDDGETVVEVDNELSSYQFDLDFDRDSDSVTSPQVNSVNSYTGEESMNSMILGFAFALLVILAVVVSMRQ